MNELDTRYELRLPKALKDEFLRAAKTQDRDGSQMIRDFMKNYIKENTQRDLFSPAKPKRAKG